MGATMRQEHLQPIILSRKMLRGILSALAIGLMLVAAPASAIPINVMIDTSALTGAVKLAFDLSDGDGAVSNSVTINNFSVSGATIGAVDTILTSAVGVNGLLPATVTLAEDMSIITASLVQDIIFSGGVSSISFRFDLSTNGNPGGPFDSFAFSLLDNFGIPLISTDLAGGLLLLAEIDGTSIGNLQVARSTSPTVSVAATQAPNVAEPGYLGLVLLGLGALGWSRKSLPR